MILIKPTFQIIDQDSGLQGIYRQIELAGRTCYKSEDKMTSDSAESFVNRMIKSGHGAMLEHGTVYLCATERFTYYDTDVIFEGTELDKYEYNKYSKVSCDGTYKYVTTNLRVLVENGWLSDLQYLCEPTIYHAKRVTVRFNCDRGISHEIVRHRVMSFAQESTRYCNYSKDKFSNQISCITPPWLSESEALEFEEDLQVMEQVYFKWLKKGWLAQQARGFLPTFLKTEVVVTGFVNDWEHFFELRCPASAHPQVRELAIPLQEEFIKRGYINKKSEMYENS